jgi:hypothetical protein
MSPATDTVIANIPRNSATIHPFKGRSPDSPNGLYSGVNELLIEFEVEDVAIPPGGHSKLEGSANVLLPDRERLFKTKRAMIPR